MRIYHLDRRNLFLDFINHAPTYPFGSKVLLVLIRYKRRLGAYGYNLPESAHAIECDRLHVPNCCETEQTCTNSCIALSRPLYLTSSTVALTVYNHPLEVIGLAMWYTLYKQR